MNKVFSVFYTCIQKREGRLGLGLGIMNKFPHVSTLISISASPIVKGFCVPRSLIEALSLIAEGSYVAYRLIAEGF